MRIMLLLRCQSAVVLFLFAIAAWSRIDYPYLTQWPITLGDYKPDESVLTKLSFDGRLFGQIDKRGDARIWLVDNPDFPALIFLCNPDQGNAFVNISFSDDSRYIIFDQKITSTSLPKGRITVFGIHTLKEQTFDAYILGGSSRSKYAISSNNILAYVHQSDGLSIQFVDLAKGTESTIKHAADYPISALTFHPQAEEIAIKTQHAKTIDILNVRTGALKNILNLDAPMPDDFGSPDASLFYWAKGSMLAVNSDLYSIAFGLNARSGEGQFPFVWMSPFAMFASNDLLAIADYLGNLNIQKSNSNWLYILQPFQMAVVYAGAFAPQNSRLAVGSDDGRIAVYDSNLNIEFLAKLANGSSIMQIAFNTSDSFITLSNANTLVLWQIHN